jgi:acyl-CoA synthetase (AMP-forming)/AMP-acid ligase II
MSHQAVVHKWTLVRVPSLAVASTTVDVAEMDDTASQRQLLGWLDRPGDGRGIRFADGADGWDLVGYDSLARSARRVAAGLLGRGVPRGARVLVVHPSGPGFVACFFGAQRAGTVPAVLAPPTAFGDQAGYREHVHGVLRAVEPALVVVAAGMAERIGAALPPGHPPVVDVDSLRASAADGDTDRRQAADLALVQFTSGSSGQVRGVRVPFDALAANVAGIRTWLGATPADAWASWLPVHHDMGLIGCLVTPVVGGNDLWLLSPEQFVRTPLRYLRCFGEHGATITATPNFALDHIVRRIRPDDLAGLDFGRWKAAVVGAERVDHDTLDRFSQLVGPFGLRTGVLVPAYGMAEATLAITGLPTGRPWSVRRPVAAPDVDGGAEPDAVTGCGVPLPGMSVRVLGEDGEPLPEGRTGEIVVSGTSVAAGYLHDAGAASLTSFDDGTLHTGDAGFLRDGQLYVLGRLGDAVKVRGRTVFAEDVEATLRRLGVPAHHSAVLLGVRHHQPVAVVLVERTGSTADVLARLSSGRVASALRARVTGLELVVLPVAAGTVTRTSSGKPRRRQLWRAFLDGRLPAATPVAAGVGTTTSPQRQSRTTDSGGVR